MSSTYGCPSMSTTRRGSTSPFDSTQQRLDECDCLFGDNSWKRRVDLAVQRGDPSLDVVCARTPLVTDRLAAAGAREMGAFRAGQQEIQPAAFDDRGRIGSVEVDAEMPGKRVVARMRGNCCVPMIDGDKVELCAHLSHSAQTAGGRAA